MLFGRRHISMTRREGAGREGTYKLQHGYAPLILGARGGTPPAVVDGLIPNRPNLGRERRRWRQQYV